MGIRYKDLSKTPPEVLFAHLDEDTHRPLVLAVERLVKHLQATRTDHTLVPISNDFAKLCFEKRGVEAHRLERLKDETITEPVVFIHMRDGSHLLVDGTHRYVATAIKRMLFIQAYLVERPEWMRFRVFGHPPLTDKALRGYSGIE